MSDYERFLKRAAQLERIARETFIHEHRAPLLEMAAEWRRLAEQIERIEQRSVTESAEPLA